MECGNEVPHINPGTRWRRKTKFMFWVPFLGETALSTNRTGEWVGLRAVLVMAVEGKIPLSLPVINPHFPSPKHVNLLTKLSLLIRRHPKQQTAFQIR
jgi:hypothetical protein